MIKKIMMENLLCSGCARKIEKEINNLTYVENASYNLAHQTMLINFSEEINEGEVLEEITKIVDSIEDGVNVYYHGKKLDERINYFNGYTITLIGVLIFILALVLNNSIIFYVSYIFVANSIIKKTINNIRRRDVFDENTLMLVATLGAMVIGEYIESIAVIVFYTLGEYLQHRAVKKSKDQITELVSLQIEYANVLENGQLVVKDPMDIKIGDVVVVKTGEKIPIDGKIVTGDASLDTSQITGESNLQDVHIGDDVLSGTINVKGVISIKAGTEYSNSTVARIIDIIENSTSNKAKTEEFITKFAKYYTPAVTIFAVLLVLIPTIFDPTLFKEYFYRAAVFLVISCPCALVLSIPLSYFAGIGKAAKNGVLFKGSNYLEALNNVSDLFFDKTGTITYGNFVVTDYTNEETMKLAASVEKYSNHPIAWAIINKYENELYDIKNINEVAGFGIEAEFNNKKILVGNGKLLTNYNINTSSEEAIGQTVIYVAYDKKYIGRIIIKDQIKESSVTAIKGLLKRNKNIYMLTGDNKHVAKDIANKIDDIECYSELLPSDKLDVLNSIDVKGYKLFVGDGINDAPVLANADIAVAMGDRGSDLAIEVADVIITNDNLLSLNKAFSISKYVRKIVTQNIVFALGIKLLFLTLGAFGIASMWMAIFADVGVSLIAVLNSLRILYTKK